ncbi:MAG: energy-coupling factor transporter ATPase [Lachnospiraceae bacterium]|nr:energy-coupling factor transporter ATPase [Lachnospiraceae bacterium]
MPPAVNELGTNSSLILDHVEYKYNPNTAYEKLAVSDLSLTFTKGEFIGLVGHTGSGKSTLIQMLNGLIKPTKGSIYFNGQDISEEGYSLKFLRSKVGMSFQYPEHQLFANTIVEDVAFGPNNLGWDRLKIDKNTFDAIKLVGLPDDCYDMSPFELSGGQKRRVAIAGVLAMEPEFIVLDEPTAGLDPKGRDEILKAIKHIHDERGITVILVSHNMDDVAKYADRLIVMNDSKLEFNDTPRRVFENADKLKEMGLNVPSVSELMNKLNELGYPKYPYLIDENEALSAIKGWFL